MALISALVGLCGVVFSLGRCVRAGVSPSSGRGGGGLDHAGPGPSHSPFALGGLGGLAGAAAPSDDGPAFGEDPPEGSLGLLSQSQSHADTYAFDQAKALPASSVLLSASSVELQPVPQQQQQQQQMGTPRRWPPLAAASAAESTTSPRGTIIAVQVQPSASRVE